ncbi:MAG: hypothetical protein ISS52_00615 [Dehalococcoidia bacterium]|nr:hypothetical protein [Dehalococcoidia bacterium]
MRGTIVLLLVMAIAVNSVLMSCKSSEPVSKAEAITASTDSNGVANLEMDGRPIAVVAVDETFPAQALPNIKVSVAEQQGVGLVYAVDEEGKFCPQLTFLNSSLSQTEEITVPLSPVGDEGLIMSEPIEIDINPDSLPKVASCHYSGLGSFLMDNYPEVRGIVFLFSGEVSDIEQSTVFIYATPFPEVIYAHLQEGQRMTGLGIIPKVHAAGVLAAIAVWAAKHKTALLLASFADEVALIAYSAYKGYKAYKGHKKEGKKKESPPLDVNVTTLPSTTRPIGETVGAIVGAGASHEEPHEENHH